jgi:tRNA1Val (adenine37-N6)-methyltransferase
MANPYFNFKSFTIFHDKTAMKVTTDACLFGAWCASEISKVETEGKKALDIGAGNGLLSLMVAQKTKLKIDAVEIEYGAAMQAGDNIHTATFKHDIKIHHSNILKYAPGGYDFIISNPPFYEYDLKSASSIKNTAHHSSNLTLEQLIEIIKSKLNQQGKYFLLLPSARKNNIELLLKKHELHIHTMVEVMQTENHKPFRIMISGGIVPEEVKSMSIQIKNDNDYSTVFIELLRDYYLYL